MFDSEIKHCQTWREHWYVSKGESKYRRKGKDGANVSAGKISINGLAQVMDVNWSTAAMWVQNYKAEGADAFLPNKFHTYSEDVKRQAVEEYQRSTASLSQICQKYKIREAEAT